jgi:hypothetical protein
MTDTESRAGLAGALSDEEVAQVRARLLSKPGFDKSEEWKKCVDLYIHHDNLKQSRVRHWLTTQAIAFAFAGLLVRETIASNWLAGKQMLLSMAILVCLLGLVTSVLFAAMDARARHFTLFHRFRLCEIEEEMGVDATYSKLALILNRMTKERMQTSGAARASQLYRLWLTEMMARNLYRQVMPDIRDIAAAAKEQLLFTSMMAAWVILGALMLVWGWPILRARPLVW